MLHSHTPLSNMWLQALCVSVAIAFWLCNRWRRMTLLKRCGFNGPPPHFIYGHQKDMRKKGREYVDMIMVSPIAVRLHELRGRMASEVRRHCGVLQWRSSMSVGAGRSVDQARSRKGLPEVCDQTALVQRLDLARTDLSAIGARHRPVSDVELIAVPPNPPGTFLCRHRWKVMRTLVTPTFSSSKLRHMSTTIGNAVEELCQRFLESSSTDEVSVQPLFQALTMDVICQCAFNVQTGCQRQSDHPFLVNVKGIATYGFSMPMALNAL